MGVATGTFGGLMRDVVANEIPLVLRQGELYVSACLAGALLSVLLLRLFPEGETLSLLTASVATFVLRAGSLRFGWRLPVYRSRAPRTLPRRSAIASPDPLPEGEGRRRRGQALARRMTAARRMRLSADCGVALPVCRPSGLRCEIEQP